MSTAMVWVVFPGLVAGVLALLRRWERGVTAAGVATCLLLAWLAWRLPIGEGFTLGPWSLELSDTLSILGRRLILSDAERPFLTLIYLAAAFWFGGVSVARAGDLFVPVGLGVLALLTASLAVDPFLYAGLFIEMAALLCVPLLATPHKSAGRGVLRFLTFQSLGVPFILFTGWLTDRLQANPGQVDLMLRASILAALGFGFLLAVFPFHAWMPMLAEESHPYTAAFVLTMLPGVIFLFATRFLENNEPLRSAPGLVSLLYPAGAMMAFTGGLWAAFQRHLGRILAYAVMFETGLAFLAIGLRWNPPPGASGIPPLADAAALPALLNSLFISRSLGLGTWALALSAFAAQGVGLRFFQVDGLGRRLPIAAGALVLAHFSVAGLPLLAGFPARLALIDGLAAANPLAALWVLLGMAGLMVSALRTLAVLVMGADEVPWTFTESRPLRLFLIAGAAVLLLAGIFPLW
jgi:formate hydrogenlyase subunit 3/multisubunit Na+/H+ antiporter MnhD subunit